MEGTEQLATLLRALGDPSRLRLLHALEQGELTVGEITAITGLSQPRVSRHLKLLCDARVLRRARDRNEVYYRADTEEDRRVLVRQALEALSPEDPAVAQDQARLRTILDKRRARADELLAELGIKPIDARTAADVAAAIGELLCETPAGPGNGGEALGRLLDVGTGTGTMVELLAARADHVVAIDRSREMRLVARARALANGLTNCTVQDGDMYALGFSADSFDTVTIDRVLGFADRARDAVLEAARVLKPSGRLIVVETRLSSVDERLLLGWLEAAGLTHAALRRSGDGVACIALAVKTRGTETRTN
jgi:ArsR family transcriptional regulator